uniref:Uncharacterized protein n=1 Tax=Knipowitschia caucasica TaxID=637954 RepID=A0AAV2MI55_KNICA
MGGLSIFTTTQQDGGSGEAARVLEQRRSRRRVWVHDILQRRSEYGEFHHLLQELRLDEVHESLTKTPTTDVSSLLQSAFPSAYGSLPLGIRILPSGAASGSVCPLSPKSSPR